MDGDTWYMNMNLGLLKVGEVKHSRLTNYAETIFYYIYTFLHLAGEEKTKRQMIETKV